MKLAKLFNKFISSKFQYESKVNERFELKTKMESLKNFQIQLNGGIEREYFRKNLLMSTSQNTFLARDSFI